MGSSLLWQTDTQLHDSVQRQLEWDPDIDAALHRDADVDAQHISVSVEGSVVTLSGHVRSCHQQQEAEHAAWAASGVSRVDNQIVVNA